ncbi:MAG: AraC family transcriptional regulator ligand-binding domain-containing protein [Miltoncostaeaceae bacterium]
MSSAVPFAVSPGWSVVMADLGVAPGDVLRRAGLPGDRLSSNATGLPPAEYYALWRALEIEHGDPDLPVRIAEGLSAEAFDPPIFAGLCSADLNSAAERIARYKRLIGPMRVIVERSRDVTRLSLEWPSPADPPPVLAAFEVVFWVAFARLGTRHRVRPARIAIPEPPDRPAFREYLGRPIERDDEHLVEFAAADAARPFLTARAGMWDVFGTELARQLAELDAQAATVERVRAALMELLPSGRGTLHDVARELTVSARTLQRRLRVEGTTFQATLDATRERLARHYLAHSSVSPGEISFLLGFEDSNSFYRAFHAWTGETPARVRATAA